MEGHFVLVITNLRWAMGVVYSLYDALVSINVPDEKAKAVIDALEREMMDKLATKADIAHLQAATKADIANLQAATKADIANLQAATKADIANLQTITKAEWTGLRELVSKDLEMVRSDMKHLWSNLEGRLEKLESRLVILTGKMMATSVVLICAILGTIIALR
jgi:hypothetical protein